MKASTQKRINEMMAGLPKHSRATFPDVASLMVLASGARTDAEADKLALKAIVFLIQYLELED